MIKNIRFQAQWLLWLMVAYIFISFSWWTVLHLKNNKLFFEQSFEIIRLRNPQYSLADIESSEAFEVLNAKYNAKNKMIFGEAFVFISLLLFGTNWIYKRQRREVVFALQQQNFLHSVSHELKSPLSGIKLGLETVLHRNLEGEKKERFLQVSMREVERLHLLIDNVLLSASLDNKVLQPQWQSLDLQALILRTVERVEHQYLPRKIAVNCPPITCLSDAWMLESIVINLLENALKYSPQDTAVTIKCWVQRGQTCIDVIDFGDGILEQDKKQVFDKFYRVGNELTRSAKGTGLGLFIVKALVKALKGSIKITDNTPRGSIFSVRF